MSHRLSLYFGKRIPLYSITELGIPARFGDIQLVLFDVNALFFTHEDGTESGGEVVDFVGDVGCGLDLTLEVFELKFYFALEVFAGEEEFLGGCIFLLLCLGVLVRVVRRGRR